MLDNAKKTLPNRTADVLLTRFTPGQRVEIAERARIHMPMGTDRYGEVASVGAVYVKVHCDTTGEPKTIHPDNLRILGG